MPEKAQLAARRVLAARLDLELFRPNGAACSSTGRAFRALVELEQRKPLHDAYRVSVEQLNAALKEHP
ncbi:hypothetical protein BC363_23250 [Ensifer sp. LC384]|nr:hypothetical protein BC363_23250 [Ensifer sp. LC384]